MNVYQAISGVMNEVQSVAKKERNLSQGFNFRGIDAVLNAVAPALRTHGVIVMPVVQSHEYATVEVGQKRTPMSHVILNVRYVFVGPEGDNAHADVLAEAMDSGDKAIAKAMSVAFRTALLQVLALPTDEPDPDASSYERATVQKPTASGKQFADWYEGMLGAPDLAILEAIGKEAGAHNLDDPDRDALRKMYIERKNQLQEQS